MNENTFYPISISHLPRRPVGVSLTDWAGSTPPDRNIFTNRHFIANPETHKVEVVDLKSGSAWYDQELPVVSTVPGPLGERRITLGGSTRPAYLVGEPRTGATTLIDQAEAAIGGSQDDIDAFLEMAEALRGDEPCTYKNNLGKSFCVNHGLVYECDGQDGADPLEVFDARIGSTFHEFIDQAGTWVTVDAQATRVTGFGYLNGQSFTPGTDATVSNA